MMRCDDCPDENHRLGGISADAREFAGGIPLVECACGDNGEGGQ